MAIDNENVTYVGKPTNALLDNDDFCNGDNNGSDVVSNQTRKRKKSRNSAQYCLPSIIELYMFFKTWLM